VAQVGDKCSKRPRKENKKVYMERTEDALDTAAEVVATSCPFCMTMLTDGLKYKDKIDHRSEPRHC
jgi:heterodisulfide reductase subunit D